MSRSILKLVISYLLIINTGFAQEKGILPLTGTRYFKAGIWGRSIEFKSGGSILLNNRIPLNQEIEIHLISPTGFAPDKNKVIFPAAEVKIISATGELLSTIPNVLNDNESKGIPVNNLKNLIVKVSLKPEIIKANQGCMVQLRYYDMKGTGQLRLEFPVIIARPGEQLLTAKAVSRLKTPEESIAFSHGLRVKNIIIAVDTSIRVAPKMAYTSLDIMQIEGSGNAEILGGKEFFWVYDQNLNEVKITDRLLKQVKGAMEDNIVDYTLKIPTRLKSLPASIYTVRFRWESPDRRKLIDIVVTK